MSTTSRRSWLFSLLLAPLAMVWPRAGAAARMPEQDGEAYAYDLPHAQPEQGDCWEFTYDHLGRLTEVRHIGEDRCRRANFLANASG